MEPLPRGAQFTRSKMLWEIALGVAGDPSIPYTGNRDVMVAIGNGSQESFRPALRMSPGSPILAHAVVNGELEAAFVNPSALLTQAYTGVGMFSGALPVRIVASYPSWDRFVIGMKPGLKLESLAQLARDKLPLRLSIREDASHSTRVLIDQLFPLYGFTLGDFLGWGGTLQTNGGPGDPRRLAAIAEGSVDLVLDEGIVTWMPTALRHGMTTLQIDEPRLQQMEALGWRRAVLPKGTYPGLDWDSITIDYSGWPLYTRANLSDEDVTKICAAIAARWDEIPWDTSCATGPGQPWEITDATPRDVPLHPAAERWAREQGYAV